MCGSNDADICFLSNHNFYMERITNLLCVVDMTVALLLLQVRVATLFLAVPWYCCFSRP
jgi:hypothetical protein